MHTTKARHTKVQQYATNECSATRELRDEAPLGKRGKNSSGYDLDFADSVNTYENITISVGLDDRCRFPRIQFESVTRNVIGVIRTTLIRRTQSNPLNDDLGVRDEFDNDIETVTVRSEHVVERPDLVKGSRITV